MGCLRCGDTGKMANGKPCTECKVGIVRPEIVLYGVPVQYQGVSFDKSFLPEKEQKVYGTFMEELRDTIVNDMAYYQKNHIICSRPNSGKTVWAYTMFALFLEHGVTIPQFRDIIEVRDILNGGSDIKEAGLYSTARCAIIKIPRDIQPWLFDSINSIVERRVRNNGFTIFLYGGSEEDLVKSDRYERLKFLRGTGSYNTVQVSSF